MRWIVEYYKDDKGKEPVAEFLDSLATKVQAKAFRLLELLGEYGGFIEGTLYQAGKGQTSGTEVEGHRGEYKSLLFHLYRQAICFIACLHQKDP